MNAPSTFAAGTTPLLPQPYLVFLGDTTEPGYAKTAFGLRDWARDLCVGEFACAPDAVSAGLPAMTPAEARAAGARSLVIGVANPGGVLPESWILALVEALDAGLSIVSGLHARLKDVPALREAAARSGQKLIDVRIPPENIVVGSGRKRSGKRLLAVGTDCALGKKYAALAIAQAFKERGISSDFRATGQTGIMISGGGMPMDAVISDFEAGAAEMLSPDAPDDHWDVIEGQGSLYHPAYAAVSLGLLHGSQPDIFVVCHHPGRKTILGLPDFPLPTIEEVIDLNVTLGKRTNPSIRCGGVAFNTADLSAEEAEALMARESARLGLPVADPIRKGLAFEALINSCLSDN